MKKSLWFGFHVIILMFSTALLLVYHIILFASSFITIPGIQKELFYIGLFGGYMIGVLIMVFSISGLWKMSTKITITPPKDQPPLDKTEFNKLCDDIKDTNIGQNLMNHVMECEDCKKKSLELNQQAIKHIEETEKLT